MVLTAHKVPKRSMPLRSLPFTSQLFTVVSLLYLLGLDFPTLCHIQCAQPMLSCSFILRTPLELFFKAQSFLLNKSNGHCLDQTLKQPPGHLSWWNKKALHCFRFIITTFHQILTYKAHTRTCLQTLSNKPQGPKSPLEWEPLTYINDSLCKCLRSDWYVKKHTDSCHTPIARDYLLYRIVLSKKDFSYLGKLTKFPNMPPILLFAHPVPCSTLLCGREGWPNRLHQRFPRPLISTWVWREMSAGYTSGFLPEGSCQG